MSECRRATTAARAGSPLNEGFRTASLPKQLTTTSDKRRASSSVTLIPSNLPAPFRRSALGSTLGPKSASPPGTLRSSCREWTQHRRVTWADSISLSAHFLSEPAERSFARTRVARIKPTLSRPYRRPVEFRVEKARKFLSLFRTQCTGIPKREFIPRPRESSDGDVLGCHACDTPPALCAP